MKHVYYLFISLLPLGFFAQSVGINASGAAPNASAGLDVDFTNKGLLPPRVGLTGPTDAATIISPSTGLLVYNTATAGGLTPGYYFNRGTAAAPYWVTFNKTQTYHASSTSSVSITTNGAITVIPGTPISITIPAGLTADIDIYATSGMSFAAAWIGTDNALVDLIVYKNGAFLPIGGWNRVKLTNAGTNTSSGADMRSTTIVSRDVNVPAGTYTYDLRGNRFSGSWGVTVGGNCASQVNCAELTLVVTFK